MPLPRRAPAQTLRTVTGALLLACGLAPAADVDDPTRGDVVLFPAPMEELKSATPANPKPLMGWNMPGRNFRAGEGWWGVSCGKGTDCKLTPLKLAITPSKHEVYDSDAVPSQLLVWSPLPASGDLLAVFKPLRAAAGLPLAAGPVKTWLQQGMDGPYPEGGRLATMEVSIPMGAAGSALLVPRLRPAATNSDTGREQREGLVLELRVGGRRQVLEDFDNNFENNVTPVDPKTYLVWAGDLDGDGKLDLLLNTGGCSVKRVLWLSSLAKGQALVGMAGSFEYFDPGRSEC